jgi:hypothetical protein
VNAISKSKPLWRGVTLRLSLFAAVFTAIYKTMDNITVHNYITATDGLTAAFAYLIIGSWTGLLSSLVFAVIAGQRIVDPEFTKLELNRKALNPNAIIAGTISAGSTLFLLWGNQLGDPSVLIALGNAVILYTIAYDLLMGQAKFSTIAIPAGLVLVGSMMTSFSGSLTVTLLGLLFVLIISNGLAACSEVVEQRGTRQSDGVNFFVWRFLWLAFSGTLLAVTVSVIRGQFNLLLQTIYSGMHYLPWIILTMFFVFLGIGIKLVAKKNDAVSVVLIVYSIQMILAFPITLLGNAIFPGVFGQIPNDISIWIIRSIGAALMIWGVIRLRKNNPD